MSVSSAVHDHEREFFNTHLEEYVARFCAGRWLGYKRYVERQVRARVPQGRTLDILDIGSGPMPALEGFAAVGHRYTCIDLASRPLTYLAEHVPGCQCVLSEAERTPFAPASFDLVVVFGLLHHLDDRAPAVAEIRRVLRPGGLVVASEPSEKWSGDSAHEDELASPDERGLSMAELTGLFAEYSTEVLSFNHARLENLATRVVRAVPQWTDASSPVWRTLFPAQHLLHRVGVRGSDYLLLARDHRPG